MPDNDVGAHTKRRRKRMLAFKIDEISAVDSPAQAHALMTIMKRNTPSSLSPEKDTTMANVIVRKREPEPQEPRDIMDLVDQIQATRRCGRAEAMRLARQQRPDLLEKFRATPPAAPPSHTPMAKSDAQRAFDDIIDSIAKRDNIGKSAAMSRARSERPKEFERAYGR